MKRSFKEILTSGSKLFYRDMRSVKWAIILLIAYFVFLKNYLYTLCPLTLFLGIPCPGCGMTRAAFCVLRMDFAGAWEIHPFIYPIICLFIIFCFKRYILQSQDMKVLKRCVVIMAIMMIWFYGWRMWSMFPDTAPMTYYEHNVVTRIFEKLQNVLE